MNKHYVIVGASAAALGAIHRLSQADSTARITVISREAELPYNKCLLADYLSGIKKEHDVLTKLTSTKSIDVQLNTEVTRILSEQKKILCASGNEISYDALLLAMGSSPYIPAIPGLEHVPFLTFHTLRDTQQLLTIPAQSRVLIVGAGLSGLECADALHTRGHHITIIDRADQVLASMMPAKASDLVIEQMRALGLKVCMKTSLEKVEKLGSQIKAYLTSGDVCEVDQLIIATGLKPNSALAQEVGIACQYGSILVDETMQTNIPGIYAAGDLIMVKDQLSGGLIRSTTWPDAMMQGGYAAFAIAGKPKPYPGTIPILSSAFFGLKYTQMGLVKEEETVFSQKEAYEQYFVASDGVLQGFVQLGANLSPIKAKRALLTREKVTLDTFR